MPELSKTYDQRKSRAQSRDEKSPPRVYIRTFGCQMNDRDSEFITGLFLEKGYKLVDSPSEADIVLFNTCSVRKHAEERAISNIGALLRAAGRRLQATGAKQKEKVFGMVGCVAQARKDELFRRLPGLNIVCGTGEIARLPELVKAVEETRYEGRGTRDEGRREHTVMAVGNVDTFLAKSDPSYRESDKHAYVSIMRGCNNFCSYCVVPYVRGHERSRNVDDIVKEIEGLVKRGINDITLLGQNVNSYKSTVHSPQSTDKKTKYNFVGLLKTVNCIEGLGKISFMTSHPKDVSVELFEAMRDLDKVVKHLHLPLQSGSDRILKLMHRCYTADKYLSLARKAREIIPNLRLTTDIIVGFPTETEEDSEDTVNLMKKIKFDSAYIFKYSPRSGTKAAELKDDVPEGEKKRRHNILLSLQKEMHNMDSRLRGNDKLRVIPAKAGIQER